MIGSNGDQRCQPGGARYQNNPKSAIAAEKWRASNAISWPFSSYHSCPSVPLTHNPEFSQENPFFNQTKF